MVISPPIQAANLGMADSLILMVLALVVFGPRRLPQIGRQIGKLMYEFRKASNDFKFQMEEELRNAEEADRRKREEAERKRTLADAQTAAAQAQDAAAQALNAATEAQNAAQAAQTAAGAQAEETGTAAAESSESASTQESSESATDSRPDYYYPYSGDSEPAPVEAEPVAPQTETELRVQPPSTGEQVAAERPGRVSKDIETGDAETAAQPAGEIEASGAGLPAGIPIEKDVAAETDQAAPESTAHHG